MKKIKFRGVAIKDYTGKAMTEKKFVYGNIWTNEDNSYVIIGEHKDKKGCCYNYVVDPDSVAQFVGYDADGKEVYEGDELIDEDESPINSLYVGIVDSDSNAIDGEIGTRFSDVWIKKERGGNEKTDF